jgi:hypothetical protein
MTALVNINELHHRFWEQRQTKINGNFRPEWGYLAPADSFIRTARIVLVATAVGATASGGVVLSLVERPAAEAGESSSAARTLTRPVDYSLTPVSTPRAARTQGQSQLPPQPQVQTNTQAAIEDQFTKPTPTNGRVDGPAASEPSTSSTVSAPASNTALAEAPVPTDASPAQAADETTPASDTTPVTPETPVTENQRDERTDRTKHATTAKMKTGKLRPFRRPRVAAGGFLAGVRAGPLHP